MPKYRVVDCVIEKSVKMQVKKSKSKIETAKVGITNKKTKEIVTPKNITTSKKLIPTTKASNNPALGQKEPLFRYSDEDLNVFRELINERLEIAKQELLFQQGQLNGRDSSGKEGSTDLRLSLEDGSGAMDREQLSHLTSRQLQYISNLEKAIIRIRNKTYGVCRETGKLIDKARLRAVPHATLSIEAKNNAQVKK